MEKCINNQGFTLVELLAVMVILVSISLVSVVGITSSLTKRGDKEKKEQIELAVGAAKIYFSLEEDSDNCVKISDLKNKGYINGDQKVDTLNSSYVIKLSGNSYVYRSSC